MFQPFRPNLSRRHLLIGATALAASSVISPVFAKGVDGFIDATWAKAKAKGVSRKIFNAALGDFSPIAKVLELSKAQPEFVSTAGDYVTRRVSDARIGTGGEMRGEWAKTLGVIAERYGVQPEIILSIWGVETNFGGFMGGTNTPHALATLTYGGYRASYFGAELITALEILEAG